MQIYISLLIGAVIMAMPWVDNALFPCIFIGFVPLLNFEQKTKKANLKFFISIFFYFIIWNTIATWWIWKATPLGSVLTIIFDTSLMSFTFFIYKKIRNSFSYKMSQFILLLPWVTFEYLHFDWDLQWPWLAIGHGLTDNSWIYQWYSFSGVLGGTIWILSVNILIFRLLNNYLQTLNKKNQIFLVIINPLIKKNLISFIIVFFVPLIFSLILYFKPLPVYNSYANIILTQPNVDPYSEKYNIQEEVMLNSFINQLDSIIDDTTEIVLGPETVITYILNEKGFNKSYIYYRIKNLLLNKPNLNLLLGSITRVYHDTTEKIPEYAYYNSNSNTWSSTFNSALWITKSDTVEFYHKSKLTPFVELVPFLKYIKLNDFVFDLGGYASSLGYQDERVVFESKDKKIKIAPVVCYESVFGKHISEYINKGANIIGVITNDGWWGGSPGYKQHFNFSIIRAVEQNRFLIRSANTGISSIIDPKGRVLQRSNFNENTYIKARVPLIEERTFYSKTSTFIGKFCMYYLILLIIYNFIIIKK